MFDIDVISIVMHLYNYSDSKSGFCSLNEVCSDGSFESYNGSGFLLGFKTIIEKSEHVRGGHGQFCLD